MNKEKMMFVSLCFLFATLFLLVDTWLFTKGYDTFIWAHRTPNELEAQRKKLGLGPVQLISNPFLNNGEDK